MKKIISLMLVTVLLLSVFSISALAEENKPEPTVGPADGVSMFGGARCGIFDTRTNKSKFVVQYKYDEGNLVVNNDEIPGVTYDRQSNTLTVKDVSQPDNELFVWYMGNDFKLNVEGTCAFGAIDVYNYYSFHNTSLNIIGSGTLTVNEKKTNLNAIELFANGKNVLMWLDIADSVTVHLYSGTDEEEEKPAPVVTLNPTVTTPAQGGAITVGGKTLAEAKSEQIKVNEPEYVHTIDISNRDEEYSRGYQVIRKSDPDGVYAANDIDGAYVVSRYIYVDAIEMWYVDDSFSYVRYNKNDFEAEFDFVYGDAPTKIDYMDAYVYERRGTEGVQMSKDGEPGAVYVGLHTGGIWDWEDEYPGNYEIHRVTWDNKQEMYVEDASFKEIDLMAGELEENGYHIVKEEHNEQKELSVWDSPYPSEERNSIGGVVMNRASDPDGLYVKTGEYTSTMDGVVFERGITIHKAYYNAEADEYYILESYDEPECFYIPEEEFESGASGFSYVYETVTTALNLCFLSKDYNIQYDLTDGIQVRKNSEPGAVYAYRSWTHYFEDDTSCEMYGLIKLCYNENLGCYLEDESFREIEFDDLSYLEENGYEVLMSNQPLEYYVMGSVITTECPVYVDAEGNRYFVNYGDEVYSFSEDNTATLGDTTYYFGTYISDLTPDDLIDTAREIVTDSYKYWIDGPEYHHAAGEPGPSTVSGSFTSYLDEAGTVTVQLLQGDAVKYTATATGNTGSYSIKNVAAGAYTLRVSKKNHVTRDVAITVSGNKTQDVKICPKGDATGDGKVTNADYSRVNQHVCKVKPLTDYALKCADVVGSSDVTNADLARINQHVCKTKPLW